MPFFIFFLFKPIPANYQHSSVAIEMHKYVLFVIKA